MPTKSKKTIKVTTRQPKVGVVCVGGFGTHALAQLEKLLAPRIETATAANAPAARFTKVSAAGALLPKSAKDWEGVYDLEQDLVFGRRLLPGTANWKDSVAKAAAAKLCGQKARAPSVRERFAITAFDRLSPALDTDYFDSEEGWEWTATEARPAGVAWYVGLGYGFAGRGDQAVHGDVRAVCAGQLFDFSHGAK